MAVRRLRCVIGTVLVGFVKPHRHRGARRPTRSPPAIPGSTGHFLGMSFGDRLGRASWQLERTPGSKAGRVIRARRDDLAVGTPTPAQGRSSCAVIEGCTMIDLTKSTNVDCLACIRSEVTASAFRNALVEVHSVDAIVQGNKRGRRQGWIRRRTNGRRS